MNKDYVSIDSLNNYLAHARTYSHKYIKREPDGHGGYRYYYSTDIGDQTPFRSRNGSLKPDSTTVNTTYTRQMTPNGRLTYTRSKDNDGNIKDINFALGKANNGFKGADELAKYYRQADKASQIYRENLTENKLDTKTPNIAQQTISTITTTAKNTYEAGMNFLKKLFSTPIITTKKTIEVHGTGNFKGSSNVQK